MLEEGKVDSVDSHDAYYGEVAQDGSTALHRVEEHEVQEDDDGDQKTNACQNGHSYCPDWPGVQQITAWVVLVVVARHCGSKLWARLALSKGVDSLAAAAVGSQTGGFCVDDHVVGNEVALLIRPEPLLCKHMDWWRSTLTESQASQAEIR